jgi:Zn-finger nucleic acid-binding protein
MTTRDRNGIMIEECGGCRGVYLDRGELELLIDAESEYLATLPAAENADTTYQGRHRHGVVQQVFGEPAGEHENGRNGQAGNGHQGGGDGADGIDAAYRVTSEGANHSEA